MWERRIFFFKRRNFIKKKQGPKPYKEKTWQTTKLNHNPKATQTPHTPPRAKLQDTKRRTTLIRPITIVKITPMLNPPKDHSYNVVHNFKNEYNILFSLSNS